MRHIYYAREINFIEKSMKQPSCIPENAKEAQKTGSVVQSGVTLWSCWKLSMQGTVLLHRDLTFDKTEFPDIGLDGVVFSGLIWKEFPCLKTSQSA